MCLAMKEKEVEGSPVLRGSLICGIVDLDPKNPSSYLPSPPCSLKPLGLKTWQGAKVWVGGKRLSARGVAAVVGGVGESITAALLAVSSSCSSGVVDRSPSKGHFT